MERCLVRQNDAWLDGTWPGYGPPLPYTERKNQSVTTRRQLSASPGRTWKNQTMGSPLGEIVWLPKSTERLRKNTERQVRSEGTPHIGHANSVTNDEHGSQSDISYWSSSNPVTRVIKVTLPTPTIYLYHFIHPYTHSFHTPVPPG